MQVIETKKESIKQFSQKSPCLCFNIRKAARAITQVYDKMFKGVGLTASQGAIVNSLRMIGPMTVSQLAEAVATERTTITRNLKPLEREGFVKSRSGQDRREREIFITEKGMEVSSQAMKIWEGFQEKMYKDVKKEEVEKVCSDLSDIMGRIEKSCNRE